MRSFGSVNFSFHAVPEWFYADAQPEEKGDIVVAGKGIIADRFKPKTF